MTLDDDPRDPWCLLGCPNGEKSIVSGLFA